MDESISHWLFWMNEPLKAKDDIEKEIRARVPSDCEYVWAPQVSKKFLPSAFL